MWMISYQPDVLVSMLQKTKIPARGLKHNNLWHSSSFLCCQLQKTKIPARGLKRISAAVEDPHIFQYLQKTKIPTRGLKQRLNVSIGNSLLFIASKNQNPREGIETEIKTRTSFTINNSLQKTKIPARGLKRSELLQRAVGAVVSSKNQNPREGIET